MKNAHQSMEANKNATAIYKTNLRNNEDELILKVFISSIKLPNFYY
jgi:hypothetical protein